MIGVFLVQFCRSCVCDVIYDPLHSVSGKFLLRGTPFLWFMWSIIQCIE